MTFLWPWMLLSLLILPAVVAAYLLLQRRRRALATGFLSTAGRQPAARAPRFRRHLPALFFLLGLAVILVALARPQATLSLPRVEGTVVLVMDVSASMAATDVEPSRLEAAKAAARDFIASQPQTVKIGIVAFSGSGFTVQAPTNDTSSLMSTIDRLAPASGTSLGQGILTALRAIAVDAGLVTNQPVAGGEQATPEPGQPGQPAAPDPRQLLAQLPEGTYPASVIVLLSDGENNESIDPAEAAQAAAEHGVRVDALGFGTTGGTNLKVGDYMVHTALDEATLEAVTAAAGGTYHPAPGEEDRKEVYASLSPQLVVKPEAMEITSVLAGAGILALMMGSFLALLWFNRLP